MNLFRFLHYFCWMQNTKDYQSAFLNYLETFSKVREPKNLYEPIHYILNLGGKRLRPVLTLMSADIFNCDYNKALDAALSIEVFHNFSLVHDDIMDAAPLRRGQQTVHENGILIQVFCLVMRCLLWLINCLKIMSQTFFKR